MRPRHDRLVKRRVDTEEIADEDIVSAFAHCERIVARRSAMDPLAAALDDPELRGAAPLYAFARVARALASQPGDSEMRCAGLQAWEDGLVDAFHGRAEHPVLVALASTVRRFAIPIGPLQDLIDSCRVDAIGSGFATADALLAHCRSSAGASARLVLHLTGDDSPPLLERAEDLAIGARLADRVAESGSDAAWIPFAECEMFDEDGELMAFQVARARMWLARGRPALRCSSPRARPLLRAVWVQALAKLERAPTFASRPSEESFLDHEVEEERRSLAWP